MSMHRTDIWKFWMSAVGLDPHHCLCRGGGLLGGPSWGAVLLHPVVDGNRSCDLLLQKSAHVALSHVGRL